MKQNYIYREKSSRKRKATNMNKELQGKNSLLEYKSIQDYALYSIFDSKADSRTADVDMNTKH